MNKLDLTTKDYQQIMDYAHQDFLDKNVGAKTHKLFLCRCYVKAFVSWLTSKGYRIIKDENK